ncbi:DUF4442 domain-containing protein [Legionella yabuuchiae]|uniref:DUF4442 domain-containing protein n=1 Tax=Legionella yabuuchiae TaxID=376727 RepID=UPI001056A53A|nr:DUF4442 domain-containing protein [Legionella yabuuchiae]
MKALTRFKLFVWVFGRFKVPMIGYTRPRLVHLSHTEIVVKLPLTRRTKNHLNSMYFGALAVGADIAGGLHGFYHAESAKVKASLVFKSFQANFLSRPESDVYFVSTMGDTVKSMIEASKQSGERINKPIKVTAYTHYDHPEQAQEVAHFVLELSLKVI